MSKKNRNFQVGAQATGMPEPITGENDCGEGCGGGTCHSCCHHRKTEGTVVGDASHTDCSQWCGPPTPPQPWINSHCGILDGKFNVGKTCTDEDVLKCCPNNTNMQASGAPRVSQIGGAVVGGAPGTYNCRDGCIHHDAYNYCPTCHFGGFGENGSFCDFEPPKDHCGDINGTCFSPFTGDGCKDCGCYNKPYWSCGCGVDGFDVLAYDCTGVCGGNAIYNVHNKCCGPWDGKYSCKGGAGCQSECGGNYDSLSHCIDQGCGTSCFIAGTKVTMTDETEKNIEDIVVGDKLLGENNTTNTVKELDWVTLGDRKLYSFNDYDNYFTTSDHPFKTTDGWRSINPYNTKIRDGEWMFNQLTGDLDAGNTLLTLDGDVKIKSIDSKEINNPDLPLYNFFLDGDYSYYADGYLVHNKVTPEHGTGPPAGGCFVEDTLISTPKGEVLIQDLKIGDEVNTFECADDEIITSTVKRAITHTPEEDSYGLYKIKTDSNEVITTGNHPFLTDSGLFVGDDMSKKFQWIGVFELEPEDFIYNEDGKREKVVSIEKLDYKDKTYNIEINGSNTPHYIANGFRVHNALSPEYGQSSDCIGVDCFKSPGGIQRRPGNSTIMRATCFPAGTQIDMADGTTKNIEDIKVEDKVKSYDEDTGEIKDDTVKMIEKPLRDGMATITFKDGSKLKITVDHPLYTRRAAITLPTQAIPEFIGWGSIDNTYTKYYYLSFSKTVKLIELKTGDEIFKNDKTWNEIVDIEYISGNIQAYSLADVDTNSNFFANGFLAHNGAGGRCIQAPEEPKIEMRGGRVRRGGNINRRNKMGRGGRTRPVARGRGRQMARGGRARPAPRGRGRKMPGGGRTCGVPGQPPCPGGGHRSGGRVGRPAPRGRGRAMARGGRTRPVPGRMQHGGTLNTNSGLPTSPNCPVGWAIAADGSCIPEGH